MKRDRLRLRLDIKEAHAQRQLRESCDFDWVAPYAAMLGELFTDGGAVPNGPIFFGPSTLQDRRVGRDWPIFANEVQLAIYRQPARILTQTNPYAIGLLTGLTSYVVGTGYTHRLTPKKGKTVSDGELSDAQDFLDAFHKRERWWQLERELFWRRRRDGEFFLWVHHKDGVPWCRTIEPEQVMPPYSGGGADLGALGSGETPEAWSFGLLSDLEDTQSIRALWFKNFVHPTGHRVDFSQIVHGKANVDRLIKRGFTDFSFDLYDALQIAGKLRRNMGVGAAVRAALAGIREHDTTSSDDALSFQAALATGSSTDPTTGRTVQHQKLEPGSFADMPKGVKFVPPPGSPDTAAQVEILQACLRGATTRYNAPDWLASAAAADNTFAGALTAESPFIKFVEGEQKEHGELYESVDRKVLAIGCEHGILPRDLLDRVDPIAKPPNPQARNTLQQAQENSLKVQAQVMSPQQWCEEDGRDYEETIREIEEHHERTGPMMQELALPDDGEGPPDKSGGAGMRRDQTQPHPPGSKAVRESKDASGHEHKGKGPGGGQFTSGGGGGGKGGDKSGAASPAEDTAAKLQATFDAAKGRMTDEELQQIDNYIATSRLINDPILSGAKLTPRQKERVAALDSAMAKTPPLAEPVTVYRGFRATPGEPSGAFLDRVKAALESGGTVNSPGYTSTSLEPNVAHKYASADPDAEAAVFEIAARHGIYMDNAGSVNIGLNKEFVLPRDAKLRVTGTKQLSVRDRQGKTHAVTAYQMEQVLTEG